MKHSEKRKNKMIPKMENIKNHKISKALIDFSHSNTAAIIIVSFGVWLIALIPTWIYLLSRLLIDPIGFWQEIALFAIFAIIIGWLQALLAIGACILTVVIIDI